jgi:hypothetical protein
LFEVSVKNDEHLVKLASVWQRIMAKSGDESTDSMLLTEAEKEDLINALQDDVNDIQKKSDELKILKEKKSGIVN